VKATEDDLKALMLRGLDGDGGAHRQLLGCLAVLLRAYYGRRLTDPADVEDLVQETLIAVHSRRASYDRHQPLTPWVYAMARYKMIDHLRRARRRRAAPLEAAHEMAGDDAAAAATAGLDLERLMSSLPARQRDAIRFVKIDGLSVSEAALRSGQSEASIKVGVHRGLKALMARVRGERTDAN